ncbi:metallophosphoesterase [Candidatus Marinimicrobia bacterium PRS2]|nr:metallophosphoesterase [Candidatus Marinimicrobia bacterium PRS2]
MIFLLIFSAVLFVVYAYVGLRFVMTLDIMSSYKYLLCFTLFVFYCFPIIGIILYFNKIENNLSTLIHWLGYTGLGFVSLLFFIQAGADLLSLLKSLFAKGHSFDPHRRAFLGLSAKTIMGGIAGIGSIWGIYNATKEPVIKRVEIKIDGLPESLRGFRMAQITDLHVGSMITGKFVKTVTRKIKELNADMLFFTGDAADGSVQSYGKHLQSLAEINPKYGKYFVTGNHEYYSDMNGWLQLIEGLGFKILVNESQNIIVNDATIMITGIPDRGGGHFSSFHKTNMEKAVGGMNPSDLKILLAHQPKDVEYALKYGFDLQLSGHTHGGQYFPFSLLVQLAHPFIKGLHKRENTWIYINQGTGYWGPPLRIGTEPEITEITLV